jgi:transcriptional regulator with AAA-type ATPase domain/tetratricopeptide (TPR) repeat protein
MDELTELLGGSPAMRPIRATIQQMLRGAASASRPPAILISGETGTGKGLIASLLHRLGPRAGRPFIDVNCAALPETLLEAELFGFERGAFTGAQQAKPGLFQAAHAGTIFLDEIGSLAEPLQAKLLKVVEERTVRRLGGTRNEPVEAWIISATNDDLRAAITQRRFREDLYHRLAVVNLSLPPLRARGQDVVLLAEHFLGRVCADYGLPTRSLTLEAKAALMAHTWPGNVRELANVIERTALMGESPHISAAMLNLKRASGAAPAHGHSSVRPLDDAIRQHLHSALTEHGGNISRTAAALGLTRNTLRGQIRRLGLGTEHGALEQRSSPPPASAAPLRDAGPPAAPDQEPRPEPAAAPSAAPPPERLRWERRRVTVLRVALAAAGTAGSAALASSQDLARAVEKIQTFGGRVEEVGPSVLEASFGAERIDEAPRLAALAALAIRRLAAHQDRAPGTPPRMQMMLHTSAVLVGQASGRAQIDRESKLQLTAALDALAALAADDAILVSAAAGTFLGRRFILDPVGPGASRPAPAYRLLNHQTDVRGAETAPGTFVGRTTELELLRARVREALGERGQVVAFVGPAGVGKTRLLREFTRASHARPFRLLEAGSPYASIGPFRPAADLIRAFFQVSLEDDPAAIRERVVGGLQSAEAGVAGALPALLALLDVPNVDPAWESLEPAVRRERMLEGVKRLLLSESRIQPLLLVFEDLHWIDLESRALLDLLVLGLPAARVLLLVTYRPEYRHEWSSLSYYTQLRIDPLPADEARQLLDHLLGPDASLGELKPRLVEWTEGNPFFLEESVRALEETGFLAGSRGAVRLVRPVATIEVPATVEEVLASRFDRVAPSDKPVLQAAAAVGRNVSLRLLAAVTDMPEDALRAVLRRLHVADILYERGADGESELIFKHILTREVIYATLAPEARRSLHARIFAVMEAGPGEAVAEQVDRLALHAFRGELWDRAVEYLRRAARRALLASANVEAVERLEQTLVALGRLPQSPVTLQQAVAIRLTLRDPLWALGRIDRIYAHLQEVEVTAHQLGDRRGLGRAACYLGQYLWAVGELPQALEAGERALSIASELGDHLLAAETELYRGTVFLALGEAERAAQILERTLPRLDQHVPKLPAAANRPTAIRLLIRCFLARSLAEVGRFEPGIACAEEAIRLAEQSGTAFGLVTALVGLGSVHLRQAEPLAAIPLLERSLELCRSYSINNWFPTVAASLGAAYAASGRVGEGLRLLEEAVAVDSAMGLVATRSLWRVYLAGAYVRAERLPEALEAAAHALRESRQHRERGYEAWALLALGRIAASQDPPDIQEARSNFLLALKLAEPLGMRPLVARCLMGLARLSPAVDHAHDAAAYRERAVRLAADLSMALATLDTA